MVHACDFCACVFEKEGVICCSSKDGSKLNWLQEKCDGDDEDDEDKKREKAEAEAKAVRQGLGFRV